MSGLPGLKARTALDGSPAAWETFDVDWPPDRAVPAAIDAVLASMLATCGDCIKILDLQGRVLFVNDAGLRMMEFDDLSLLEGRRWTDFMVGDGALAADNALARTARGETARFLLEARSAKGNVRFWDVQMTPIRDQHGRPTQIFTIARNATEQRLLEQQKERLLEELKQANETLERRVLERTGELAAANRRLTVEMAERTRMDGRLQDLQNELFHAARLSAAGQMAATLAHELNQPLTATTSSISAARRLLAHADIDLPTTQEVIAEAANQARRAGQVIRRLRDFIARGETEMRFESVVTMVEEAGALSLVGANAFGVTTCFGFDSNVSVAFVDRIQIQQVLVNLMRNATEAMAGCPARRLDVTTALIDDGMVEIAVADTGPGLPKHVADHLFEPFVSTKRNGMGLGLSICRSIIHAHGGRIWSGATPGGGTVFRFTIMAATTEHEAGAH